MTDRERRDHRGGVELRSAGDNPLIFGYGATFNKLSRNLGGFVERVDPQAFDKTLNESDPAGLFNHDPNQVLGRASAKTLRLATDNIGLAYEIDPPDTTLGRDLPILLKRGDITGSSFSFGVIDDEWGLTPDGFPMRTLIQVGPLYDVGPVTFPAYDSSPSAARSALASLAEKRSVALEEVLQAVTSGQLPVLITGKRSDAQEPGETHSGVPLELAQRQLLLRQRRYAAG